MTKAEYLKSGCYNKHCKFTLKDGKIEYGVITDFFPDEHDKYYLVRSLQMIEFKKYMDASDYAKMKGLSNNIDLGDIASAETLDSFQELLLNKKSETGVVDWEKRKQLWLESIDKLFVEIKEWLSSFEKEGLLSIDSKEIDLNEEYLGHYKTNKLVIFLGNEIISIIPKGTLIIGSYGRLDMQGPKGEAILVEKEWHDWTFFVRKPKIEYIKLNAESFKSAITELING